MFKIFSFYFVIAFVVSSYAYADELCEDLKPIVEKINADAGANLDSYTVNVGASLLCETKILDYKKKLLVPFSALNNGWQDRKQQQWNYIYCQQKGNEIWKKAINNGWTVATTITSSEGEYFYMKAECK